MKEPARQGSVLRQIMRSMRASVAAGRPMTLPNLLRLHARGAPGSPTAEVERRWLRAWYLRRQPFRSGRIAQAAVARGA